jgi:hypothetical protein
MGNQDSQRAAHAFLLQHFLSGRPFTLEEFRKATGWEKESTFNTYLSKQFKGLIEKIEDGPSIPATSQYRVTESFRDLVEWRQFRQRVVTQVRPNPLKSHERIRSDVLIYEFLMPLTHETQLRTTLDTLFFKDTILTKLRTIRPSDLENHFPRSRGQSEDGYFDQVVNFIENNFVGYSISHVAGRFRAVGVLDYDHVASFLKRGRRYLIDETTAVTRFIFPYSSEDELNKIRFLFQELFVRSMIDLAQGEKQIWMLESGPEIKVHIWRAAEEDDADEDDG